MERMKVWLTAVLTGAMLIGCAAVSTDEAAQDMVEVLEEKHGIDPVLVQTPTLEGDHMSTFVTFNGDCEIKIIDTGVELRVVAVQGDPIGYEPDLATDAAAQFKELCGR